MKKLSKNSKIGLILLLIIGILVSALLIIDNQNKVDTNSYYYGKSHNNLFAYLDDEITFEGSILLNREKYKNQNIKYKIDFPDVENQKIEVNTAALTYSMTYANDNVYDLNYSYLFNKLLTEEKMKFNDITLTVGKDNYNMNLGEMIVSVVNKTDSKLKIVSTNGYIELAKTGTYDLFFELENIGDKDIQIKDVKLNKDDLLTLDFSDSKTIKAGKKEKVSAKLMVDPSVETGIINPLIVYLEDGEEKYFISSQNTLLGDLVMDLPKDELNVLKPKKIE